MHIGGRSPLCQVAGHARGCLRHCARAGIASILREGVSGITAGFLAESRQMLRKFLAILSLTALILAALPALAESFSASNLPACCNTMYCPLHHRQGGNLQQDKSICGALGNAAGNDCSMRACDMTPNPAVGTALFVLATPMAIAYRTSAEPAPIQVSDFFPFHLNLPSTPPPRTLPS